MIEKQVNISHIMTFFKLCKIIVRWLITVIIRRPQHVAMSELFLVKVENWCHSEGRATAVKRLKAVRLHVTRYLSGHPLFEPTFPGMALNKKGLPRLLGPIQSLIEGDI